MMPTDSDKDDNEDKDEEGDEEDKVDFQIEGRWDLLLQAVLVVLS